MRSGSLYVHVPFCRSKCYYCHFYIVADSERAKERYMAALRREWEMAPPLLAKTLYFGGGTPALLGPERIGEIIDWIPLEAGAEVTLEANPENLDPGELAAFAAAGVNRLSVGLQSTDTEQLYQLGRRHTGPSSLRAIEKAALSIPNLSIDLMYDLPNQTTQQWHQTLIEALELPITHLSLYNLTIEPRTAFFEWKKGLSLPSEEESLAMLEEAIDRIEGAGLPRYEISAFGCESVHNTVYWRGAPFLGLGPSAFSYLEGRRFRKIAHLRRWAEATLRGESAIDFEEELTPKARERELLALGLRLFEGVDVTDPPEEFEELCDRGWLKQRGAHYQLTREGALFYDELASIIIL